MSGPMGKSGPLTSGLTPSGSWLLTPASPLFMHDQRPLGKRLTGGACVGMRDRDPASARACAETIGGGQGVVL